MSDWSLVWFWVIGGLMTAGALSFVIVPMVRRVPRASKLSASAALVACYRDQVRELEADLGAGTLSREYYEESRGEIERRLLDDVSRAADGGAKVVRQHRWVIVVLALAVPSLAASVYLLVGRPQALTIEARMAGRTPHGLNARDVEAMVGRLSARLRQDPEDAAGWVMLARSYIVLRRYDDAVRAYENAIDRLPTDAQLLADYADVLAITQGRRLRGAPEKFIERALAADPDNIKALALAGSVAYEKHEYSTAVEYWSRAVLLVPPGSEFARSIRSSITQAQALAGRAARGGAQGPP